MFMKDILISAMPPCCQVNFRF